MSLATRFLLSLCALAATSQLLFAQCDEVTQGTEPANSGCFLCPFPASVSGNNSFATPTGGGNWCTSIENDEFIGFTAVCQTVSFALQVSNCAGGTNGDGLQIAIVDADFNLFNCTSGVGAQYTATLPSCGDYYIRLDGISGSGCDYTISPTGGVLDENFAAPTAAGSINGQATLCEGQSGSYMYQVPMSGICGGAPACSDLCWDISFSSPLLAPGVSFDPADAFGFACTETGVMAVDIAVNDLSSLPPGSTETIFLSATPSYGCLGPGTQSQVFEIQVTRPPDQFLSGFACPGEEFVYQNVPYSPGSYAVDETDANGCPFTTNLLVSTYPPSFGPTVPLAVCQGDAVTICPDNPITNPMPGLNTCAIDGAAATGCDSIVTYDVYYLDPAAVISAPDTALDCNQNDLTLAVDPASSQGDTTSYAWSSDGPVFATNAAGTEITVTEAGTYYLEVTLWGSQDPMQTCTATDTVVVTSDAGTPLSAPDITGLLGVCIGDDATYATSVNAAVDTYAWTANGATPATGNGASFAVNWPTAGTYQVCLTVENACSTSDQTCVDVTVGDDQPNFTLEGATTACTGENVVLGITPFATTATYTITDSPAGSVATIDGDSLRVQLGASGGRLCLSGQGNCGGATEVCVTLDIASGAAAPQVSGPTSLCAGQTGTYTINADPLVTSATWTATGGTVLSQNATSAEVEWTAGANRSICVDIADACGTTQRDCLTIAVASAPGVTISGGGDYCAGDNDLAVQFTLVGAGPFTLVYSYNGTQRTETVTGNSFEIDMPAPGRYSLVSVENAAGCPGTATGSVDVTELPAPTATIAGTYDVCTGSNDAVDIPVALTGTPPFALTIALGGSDLPAVPVNANTYTLSVSDPGTYTISAVADASGCTGSGSGSATVIGRDPLTLVSVSADCIPGANEYEVTVVLSGGDVATYANTGTTAGAFSGPTFRSGRIASGDGYVFVFEDQYGCSPLVVDRASVNCDCDNSAGTMGRDEIALCGPGTIDLDPATSGQGATSLPGDVLAYYLHGSATGTLTGVLDSALTPSFTFDASRYDYDQVYYVSAASGDDGGAGYPDRGDDCLDVALGQPIVWRSLPTAQLGQVTAACVGDESTAEVTFTGNAPFTIIYTLGGVAMQETFAGSPATLRFPTPAASADLMLVRVVDENGCEAAATGAATIDPLPTLSITDISRPCDPTNTTYTVTFRIVGGDPATLQVQPAGSGTLVNGVFTSLAIDSGEGYSFSVTDANGCSPEVVSAASYDCSCGSAAAPIAQDVVTTCGPNTVTLAHSHASSSTDGNDVTGYVLHDATGVTLGTVFARTTTPVFDFDAAAGMVLGATYYASPVVGDEDGAGLVLLTDPCLAVAQGQPLVWTEGPSGELAGDAIICETGSATITLILNGPGPFDATLNTDDSGAGMNLEFSGIQSGETLTITPDGNVYYVLAELSNADCTVFPNDSVYVEVDQLVNAGTATGEDTRCAQDGSVIDLSTLHTGQTGGGEYRFESGPTDPGADLSAGTFANTGVPGGRYTFRYVVGEGGACPQDAETLVVNLTDAPIADAGADQELSCQDSVVVIGGASSTGANLIVEWTGGVFADATALTQRVGDAGTYTLTITDPAGGCTTTDEVTVNAGPGRITDVEAELVPVDCDGGGSGRIFVSAPTGGEAPYRYSLDGGAPSASGEFDDLAPGTYVVTVTDANGCRLDRALEVASPAALAVDAGPNLEIRFGESPRVDLLTVGDIARATWTGGPVECLADPCTSVRLAPTATTNYAVVVEDENGCTSETSLQVIVRRERPVFLPTGFSPNGDLNNDVFFVQAPEGIVERVLSMQVYDRWGEAVFVRSNFAPNDPLQGWDGTGDDEQAFNPGVFVYVLEVEFADGVVETLRGDVTLVR